jgi:hypothetical protein
MLLHTTWRIDEQSREVSLPPKKEDAADRFLHYQPSAYGGPIHRWIALADSE